MQINKKNSIKICRRFKRIMENSKYFYLYSARSH